MCSTCLAIPTATIKLLATSLVLLYTQRSFPSKNKYMRYLTLTLTILIALVLSALGLFLLYLQINPDFRARNFVNLCVSQNLKGSPLDQHRCGILERANITGRVLEFGPGPGTNFKCYQNYTSLDDVEKYVAVEPNSYFEQKMMEEKEKWGLNFPLEFVGMKGENVEDDASDGMYDVVIMTHVLCSVDSAEAVLANAERALKPGGRMVFMEHVLADEGSVLYHFQTQLVAPVLQIVGNGCKFQKLHEVVEGYLGDRFDVEIEDFDAPMPKFMVFARPHIKGVAVKK